MLAKAVAVALKGDVTDIDVLARGGVRVTSVSQSGTGVHTSVLLEPEAYLLRGNGTYHLGLLALAEALANTESLGTCWTPG